MKIALKCEKCGHIFMQDNDDDLCLEIDFREKEIIFICRNKNCNHENKICFKDRQEQAKNKPLPKIGIM